MSHTITISGKKNKVLSKIKMPKNVRVAQIAWSERGDVSEVSFQFGESEIEASELESDIERVVGFVRNQMEECDEEDCDECGGGDE